MLGVGEGRGGGEWKGYAPSIIIGRGPGPLPNTPLPTSMTSSSVDCYLLGPSYSKIDGIVDTAPGYILFFEQIIHVRVSIYLARDAPQRAFGAKIVSTSFWHQMPTGVHC